MRILVTGSSGLVGRPLCEAIRSNGDVVDEFDLRPPPDRSPTPGFRPRDIRDALALRDAVVGVDGVVHLAAVSRCAPAEDDPPMARATNVDGTRNLLEALQTSGDGAWLVFASSREVYGEVDSVPVSEEFPIHPKGVYGQTKAEGEALVQEYSARDDRRTTILRFANLYGSPWDYPDRVIPAFLSRARVGQPLEVRGPSQVLDFLDVRDGVEAILRAVERSGTVGRGPEPVNIASGTGCSLRELADQVVAVTGSHSAIREVAPAAWTPSKFIAGIVRARSVLGWRPTISLTQGLRDMAAEYAKLPAAG